MMYDLISSFSAGLLVICIANLYFSYDIISNHKYEENDPWKKEKHRFAIGVNLISIFIFFLCVGWLLWDGDIISKVVQYKLGLLGRVFAWAGSFLFFLTFSLAITHKKKISIIIASILATVATYIFKAF